MSPRRWFIIQNLNQKSFKNYFCIKTDYFGSIFAFDIVAVLIVLEFRNRYVRVKIDFRRNSGNFTVRGIVFTPACVQTGVREKSSIGGGELEGFVKCLRESQAGAGVPGGVICLVAKSGAGEVEIALYLGGVGGLETQR
ncbi:MAG: hypothetical protein JWQ02_1301 [Capsulimonas sp.]|nr:hypothetical protein [Capsulimonas sp.]